MSVPAFCLLPVSDCTCACSHLLTPAPLPACSCLLPLRMSVPACCLLPVSDYTCACPCLLTPALPIVLPPPAPTCRLSAAPSRAHQAPFCARELLKTGAVSENAPGAHRDVPRDGECSTDGRRTRTVIRALNLRVFAKLIPRFKGASGAGGRCHSAGPGAMWFLAGWCGVVAARPRAGGCSIVRPAGQECVQV